MKLFQIKSNPQGVDLMERFLADNYVSIGWTGLGNLENSSIEDIRESLTRAYGEQGLNVNGPIEELNAFVNTMQDGDYVLVGHEDTVYLGDLGDYYYVESSDSVLDGVCHRRGVTWLTRIPRIELNASVQELLNHPSTVKEYDYPILHAQLDRWISAKTQHTTTRVIAADNRPQVQIDRDTIVEALEILKEAMRSEDAERRERAAAAILRYASSPDSKEKPNL
jgi:predicted Mrr-cat superfamily restriction endonuclease